MEYRKIPTWFLLACLAFVAPPGTRGGEATGGGKSSAPPVERPSEVPS